MARGDAGEAPARRDRVLDHELIIQLGRDGIKAADVMRAHIEAHPEVGPFPLSSIYSLWHRAGIDRRHIFHVDLIPWVIRTPDLWAWPVQALRLEGKRRDEGTEPEHRLKVWLETRKRTNTVVHYDPDDPRGMNGFLYTDRRPGLDTDLIRSPWFTDRGVRIEHPAALRPGAKPPWESSDPEPSRVVNIRPARVIDLTTRRRAGRRPD